MNGQWDDLMGHVTRTTHLPPAVANRVIEDVLAYFNESAEVFVRRRHDELQQAGLANAEIFGHIAAELASRPVTAPRYSERQIRRLIYG